MDGSIVGYAILAVVFAVAVWTLYSKAQQQPLQVSDFITATTDSFKLAHDLATVAQTVVKGKEQLLREGRLTNDEAYAEALDEVRSWIPADVEVTNEQIISAINAAILDASAITHAIKASKTIYQEDYSEPENDSLTWRGGSLGFSSSLTDMSGSDQ